MEQKLHLSEPLDQSRHSSGMNIEQARCICGSLLPSRHKVFNFLLLVIVELGSSTADAACFARRVQSNARALPKHRPLELSERAHYLHHHAPSEGGRINRLGQTQKASP